MSTLDDFRNRINNDAVFAAQFAEVKNEDDFFEQANEQGYNITQEDIYQETELADEQLHEVQGGILLSTIILAIAGSLFVGGLVTAGGAGITTGFWLHRKYSKK